MLFSLVLILTGRAAAGLRFYAPLFSDGMILQRGEGTRAWGNESMAGATVTVTLEYASGDAATATTAADGNGTWLAELPALVAGRGAVLRADDAATPSALVADVAVGEVFLCSGQSNMGFGMCGAESPPGGTPPSQTPQAALDALPADGGDGDALRFYLEEGGGSPFPGGCATSDNATVSDTPARRWLRANASNAGAMSAVCLLSAQYTRAALGADVPFGAVEAAVGGTPIDRWKGGSAADLYDAYIRPLRPMRFAAILWDQGEADVGNSTHYAQAILELVDTWRADFPLPGGAPLPFVYVELDSENGAEEPDQPEMWLAQRAALTRPAVGFATTTDIQRGTHPPDKQDVAQRLALELARVAYAVPGVVARGPELVSAVYSAESGELALAFSNDSLVVHDGIATGSRACEQGDANYNATVVQAPSRAPVPFRVDGGTVFVRCDVDSAGPAGAVLVNPDTALCFLYGPADLPAPPIAAQCNGTILDAAAYSRHPTAVLV